MTGYELIVMNLNFGEPLCSSQVHQKLSLKIHFYYFGVDLFELNFIILLFFITVYILIRSIGFHIHDLIGALMDIWHDQPLVENSGVSFL